ncbi:MAG: VWA domain-containing protein [Alphaproteobacteria bacterium]|nr:VWA domain-containing protein [Alphaproteobacteria bacterium]MBF0251137.1 VWA domain-containing protein [Alphaproteobacteria bacterium]
MTDDDTLPSTLSNASAVDAFLGDLAKTPVAAAGGGAGRLLFAMDATASREQAWDQAARIQHEMFESTRVQGGLAVQLAFFRGFGEFKVSGWLTDAAEVHRLMSAVFCLAGETQVEKVLKHARNEATRSGVRAMVYVGDCFEENLDRVGRVAGELGLLGVPAFMFHEGQDPHAERAFRHIAKLSGGAYARFDAASPETLRALLGAVAVFAAGGAKALDDFARVRGGAVLRIADQMRGRAT